MCVDSASVSPEGEGGFTMRDNRQRRRARFAHRLAPLWFLAPALAVYALFVLVPIADSFRLSLFHWRNPYAAPEFVGLANYRDLIRDPIFWSALGHNVLLLVLSVAVQLPVALFLAVLLHYPTRCRGLFRTAFFAPMIMPTVAIAVLWSYVYLPEYGLLDQLVRLVDRQFAFGWLSHPRTAMLCVFLTICWRHTGFHLVLFMAGLAAIPDDLYEAARLDGASEWQVCRHVTVPLLAPVIRVSATLAVIGSLKYFDLVYMMAAGAPERSRELLATYIYRLAFAGGQGRYGYGSAVAVILFTVAIVIAATLTIAGSRTRGGAGARDENMKKVFVPATTTTSPGAGATRSP